MRSLITIIKVDRLMAVASRVIVRRGNEMATTVLIS